MSRTEMRSPTLTQLPHPPHGKLSTEPGFCTDWHWKEASPQLPDTMPDGSPWPRISIVTPSYNQDQFIEDTVRSVLLQGYPNLEYFIIDGGSTDNSVELIKKYESWLAYWTSEKDQGQTHAINKGFHRVTGEIFAWLNSDDVYLPGALHRVANEFQAHKELVMLAGECINVDISGREISRKGSRTFDPLTVLISAKPAQPATFFHSRMLKEVGYLREDLHFPLDREYVLRIGQHYYPKHTLNIDVPLACARIWDGAKTPTSNHRQAIDERKQVINMYLHLSPYSKRRLRVLAYRRVYVDQAKLENKSGNLLKEILCWTRVAFYSRDFRHFKKLLRCLKNFFTRLRFIDQFSRNHRRFSRSRLERK
jgi:glycosyltransferase involved in cell wall biosynthesis